MLKKARISSLSLLVKSNGSGTKAIDGAFTLNLLYRSITVLSISVLRKKSIEARLLATCIWAQIAPSAIIAAIRAINAVPMGAILAMVSQQLKSVRHFTIASLPQSDCGELKPWFYCWRDSHFQQCAEFPLLRNRGLRALAVSVLSIPFARRPAATACPAVKETR